MMRHPSPGDLRRGHRRPEPARAAAVRQPYETDVARPDRVDPRRLGAFLGLLVLLASLFVVVARSTGASMVALAPAYMFTPLAAGLAVSFGRGIPAGRLGLRIGRVRVLAVSALLALPLVVATLAVSLAVPGVAFDPGGEAASGLGGSGGVAGVMTTLVLVVAAGTTVNALLAFGEEVGWRGYLLWELAPLGFWQASTVVGLVWGLWHAPIIIEGYNFPSFPFVGVGVMTLACVAFAPLYTYVVCRAGSVLAATFLHGMFNGSAGMVLAYTTTEHPAVEDLVANPVGAAGIVVFGLVAAGIAVRGVPRLDRSFARAATPSDRSSRRDAASGLRRGWS